MISGGARNDARRLAGAATPPTEAIDSVGAFERVTGLGWPKVCSFVEQRGTYWLKSKASTRMIPPEPAATLKLAGRLRTSKHGLPETVFATIRIAPPDPLPPVKSWKPGPPAPPRARIPRLASLLSGKEMLVELAIRIAPPPPPPPPPTLFDPTNELPPPPPDPPISGSSVLLP